MQPKKVKNDKRTKECPYCLYTSTKVIKMADKLFILDFIWMVHELDVVWKLYSVNLYKI